MASGIFAILDDIAMLMDDTAAMSKVAAQKTAGLLGDDLAVNAEKATGFHASRELPVIWAITKGSFLNKLIILPIVFLLFSYAPWLIVPILLVGGVYLSYEGAEKVYQWIGSFRNQDNEKPQPAVKQISDPKTLLAHENKKIKAAIRTDFILSIEIIVLALSTVIEADLPVQILVVSLIAVLATFAVYGLVALLVRMDDAGYALIEDAGQQDGFFSKLKKSSGQMLVAALPKAIRLLTIVGTIAMLLVGGGMFVHNIEFIHHLFTAIPALLSDLIVGFIVGTITVVVLLPFHKPHSQNETSAHS